MHHRLLVSMAALWLIGCSSTVNQTVPARTVVPISAVDYAALSAEAAGACEAIAPGTTERIRTAHERWRARHHAAAQQRVQQSVEEAVQAEVAQRGLPIAPLPLRQQRWREQSQQDLKNKMAALDNAALGLYCERWPALFDLPAMQFAAPQPTGMTFDYPARFTEAARLCDARAPGSGGAVLQALERWQAQHGAAKDKLWAGVQAQELARADAVGGRILSLEQQKSWQRARAVESQQQLMQGLSDSAVRPYCERLPGLFARADMDFSAQWQAFQRTAN